MITSSASIVPSSQSAVKAASWLFRRDQFIGSCFTRFLYEEEWLICQATCSAWFKAYQAGYWWKINKNLNCLVSHLFKVVAGSSEGRRGGHWFKLTTTPLGETFIQLEHHDCRSPIQLYRGLFWAPVHLELEFVVRAHDWNGPTTESAFTLRSGKYLYKTTSAKRIKWQNKTSLLFVKYCKKFLNKQAGMFWEKALNKEQVSLWKSNYLPEHWQTLQNCLSCNSPQSWAYWMMEHPIYMQLKTQKEEKAKDKPS